MEHKHRKAREAEGGELNGSKYLDSLVIRGEHLASFLTRRGKPPQVTLNRIMDLVEKAQNFKHTYKNHGEINHLNNSQLEKSYYSLTTQTI